MAKNTNIDEYKKVQTQLQRNPENKDLQGKFQKVAKNIYDPKGAEEDRKREPQKSQGQNNQQKSAAAGNSGKGKGKGKDGDKKKRT